MIWNEKPRFSPPTARSRRKSTVVRAATTSTTNITGFFIRVRGSSLAKAEPIAGMMIFGSASAETGIRLRRVVVFMVLLAPLEAHGVQQRVEQIDEQPCGDECRKHVVNNHSHLLQRLAQRQTDGFRADHI